MERRYLKKREFYPFGIRSKEINVYEEYWSLKEKPFSNTADPKFLYPSQEHGEALSRLIYAVTERLGACMLTGIFGCGKTLLSQALMDELTRRGNYKICRITNPVLTHIEFLRTIAFHLGAQNLPEKKSEILTDFLLEKLEEILYNNMGDGKDTVLIVDEAHVIEDKLIFEELRLLLNFQVKDKFLLSLILIGQPELKKSIDNIKQFVQRIPIRCHLERLKQEEVKEYILYRLKVVGRTDPIFSEDALRVISEKSGGIPRRINHICDMGLLSAGASGLKIIDTEVINDVVRDLEA